MDSISSYEFHEIFDRVTVYIDLEGKCTEYEIQKSLEFARDKCRRLAEKAKTAKERNSLKRDAISYNNLVQNRFAARVIEEATNNPDGIIALTLLYGKAEAKQRILAQERARIRAKRSRAKLSFHRR
jgi:hypothetical protein